MSAPQYRDDKEPALVIDIETKRSFQEVGGHRNMAELGVSVVGVYDYLTDDFFALEEDDLTDLADLIKKRNRVIGFNIKGFDWPVLQPHLPILDLSTVPTLDMLEEIKKETGFRVALNNIAKRTLGEEKSGDGLEAVEWFRKGEIEKVKKYCLDDVRITRDVFEYGNNHGVVRFDARGGGVTAVTARWAPKEEQNRIEKILYDAFKNKKLVEIDYITGRGRSGGPARQKREIEIHSFSGDVVEAFCHLRGKQERFTLQKIVTAQVKEKEHTKPTLF